MERIVLSMLYMVAISNAAVGTPDTKVLELKMPGVRPNKNDQYICFAKKLPSTTSYVVGYQPSATSRTVHHMLVFTCSAPGKLGEPYNCLGNSAICQEESTIIFAWGRDAQGMQLPEGVGVPVGSHTGARYVVMQLHYTDKNLVAPGGDHSGLSLLITSRTPRYISSVFLFTANARLPPHQPVVNVDVSCQCSESRLIGCSEPLVNTLHPFAFRVHAHSLATQITAYIIRHGKWIMIGTQSPQRPQAFYPLPDPNITILPSDILTARCTYNTTARENNTMFGSTRQDEMCNFYLMYYVPITSSNANEMLECFSRAPHQLSAAYPHSPPLPFFNGTEGHHHHHHHMEEANVVPNLKMQPWPVDSPTPGILQDVELGQVGGVAVSPVDGRIYVFHRGPRVWNSRSFDISNNFNRAIGPIPMDTVLVMDQNTGKVLAAWGKNLFYMPHGITVDGVGNVWVTDVGLHQVLKFSPDDLSKPSLVLGTRFVPDNDRSHFCKPADVLVDSNGFIYVADGYCNQRIVKFDPFGNFLLEWGARGLVHRPRMTHMLHVPHALTMSADEARLCVADRENGRILCYNPDNGRLLTVTTPKEFNGLVYSIAFSKYPGGFMYAVNYAKSGGVGFTLKADTKSVLATWAPLPEKHFSGPHTMAVGKDGSVYVGEIGEGRLLKFQDVNVAAATTTQFTLASATPQPIDATPRPVDVAVDHIQIASTPIEYPMASPRSQVQSTSPASSMTLPPETMVSHSATVSSDTVAPASTTTSISAPAEASQPKTTTTTVHESSSQPAASTTNPVTTSFKTTPATHAIDFIPSVPAILDFKESHSHAEHEATGTSAPHTTAAAGFFGRPISTNAGVVFLVTFLCSTLLLIVVVATGQYCRRQGRTKNRGTPLQKLIGLKSRNGRPPGSEFQKLEQEASSDSSEGF